MSDKSARNEEGAAMVTRAEILRALREARGRVARGWAQGAAARTAMGVALMSPLDAAASCWCFTGALEVAVGHDRRGPLFMDHPTVKAITAMLRAADKDAYEAMRYDGVPAWNNKPGRTQADILAVYDRLIAAAEALPAEPAAPSLQAGGRK